MQSGLAQQLVTMGFAVLTYDKRGVGESGGHYTGVSVSNSETVLTQLSRDAASASVVLFARHDVDRARVGFFGVSQAGWIIPPALALVPRGSFAVILVGPTVSVGEEIYYSSIVENASRTVADGHHALEGFTGPFSFDPRASVSGMVVPALCLYGAEDRSIPTLRCVQVFDELRNQGRVNHTVRVYEGQGHSLALTFWIDAENWLRQHGILPGG